MRRICLWLTLVMLSVMVQLIATVPMRQSLRAQISPNYVRAMAAYRKLQPRLPREELRAITAIGILNGAREAEQKMEQHLVEVVKDLLLNTGMTDDELLSKIERIEKQLTRDHRALTILTGAMDLVTGVRDVRDFKADMQQTLQQIRRQSNVEEQRDGASEEQHEEEGEKDLSARVATLRRNILDQVNAMKALVEQKIEQTLEYLIDEADENGVLAKASNKVVRKRDASAIEEPEVAARVRMIKSILTEDDFRNNLVDADPKQQNDLFDSLEEDLMPQPAVKSKNVIANRSSSRTTTSLTTTTTRTKAKPPRKTAALTDAEAATATTTAEAEAAAAAAAESVATPPDLYETELAHQEEESSSEPETPEGDGAAAGGGGGGLVGLISNLSGGEGGSDIGALIGALTGVISNLFGPNGLDIESLISTSTSLISGLLSGNKNFGTVLGQYVGTAFDGLSGGGGADPEEDDGPVRPLQFAQNVISSFWEAKNRKASEEETEERKIHTGHDTHSLHSTHSTHSSTSTHHKGGSDSGGFIKQIVSHLVSSALSLVLNASLGAVSGASQASTSLFTGSSHKHGGGEAAGGDGGGGGVKTW